jgi:hypothetical protein
MRKLMSTVYFVLEHLKINCKLGKRITPFVSPPRRHFFADFSPPDILIKDLPPKAKTDITLI